MSSWSEGPPATRTPRSLVLRGGEAATARPARIDADLRTSPFAPTYAVDARLTDPHLQSVVAAATRASTEAGRQDGHRAGYAAGLAAAAAQADVAAQQQAAASARAQEQRDAQLRSALDLLGAAADAFRSREAVTVSVIEDTVVDLALGVARAVLDRELAVSVSPGREAVARALQLAPENCPATVRLHPDDASALGDVEDLAAGRQLLVVADPSVEPGGCVVDAAGGQVDAQIGTALSRVAAVLHGVPA